MLKALAEAGQVAPVIDRTFPLSEATDAIDYLESGRHRGKVAISILGERGLVPRCPGAIRAQSCLALSTVRDGCDVKPPPKGIVRGLRPAKGSVGEPALPGWSWEIR